MPATSTFYDFLQVIISVIAIIISVVVAIQATQKEKRAEKKAEAAEIAMAKADDIKLLLGEKETVGFAAIKLMQDGLPQSTQDRKITISAIINACLFERSDRARAVLFYVIEINKKEYLNEFKSEFEKIKTVIATISKYIFEKEELDLSSAKIRLGAVEKIINTN